MSHVPRSISLQWDDFSQEAAAQKGILQSDLDSVARRLARLGIAPDSKIIVVGNGEHGSGQEGRVAWMFRYLGLKDVEFVDLMALKGRLDHTDIVPGLDEAQKFKTPEEEITAHARAQADQINAFVKPAPIWTPVPDASLLATRDEVMAKHAVFIDVRTQNIKSDKNSLGAIHISWKNFLTTTGRPNAKVKALLEKNHISQNERIICIDDQGVAAGEVTLVLRELGYSQAANYAGGWNDLASANQR
jgi:3-mercaptopyruvate sulfurtransferase SseA